MNFRSTDVVVSPSYIEDFKEFLNTSDYNYDILMTDVQVIIRSMSRRNEIIKQSSLFFNYSFPVTEKHCQSESKNVERTATGAG